MADSEKKYCTREDKQRTGGRYTKFETSGTIGKHCNNYKQ